MTTRPWTPFYAEGTRPEIDPLPHANLAAFYRGAAAKWGSKIAFDQCMPNGMGASLTYAQADRLSDQFAAYLREDLGLQTGDRVAVQMPNCLAYPVVLFGIFKAGCVAVNTNPLYTPPEMVHQYNDSGAKVLVIIDMFADRLPKVLPNTPTVKTVVTVRITEYFPTLPAFVIRTVLKYVKKQLPPTTVPHTTFQEALASGARRISTGARVESYVDGVGLNSVAALQYTGGTTGVSKGAMLSHGNLLSNVTQMIEMNRKMVVDGQEIVLTALPLYHIFAFTCNLLFFVQSGSRNVLVPSPRPPSNLKSAWEKYPITWFSGVNTLFNALANEPWFIQSPPKSLKSSVAGGMALHQAVAERWREVTGTDVVEGYGLTETSPVTHFNPFGKVRPGTIGIPLPSTDVLCTDDEGRPVAPGTPGEITIRGPQVMLGYWNRPEETAKVLQDGWLRTGDVGVMDEDGYFKIVDRMKDMILVSGFNVYPNEVEEVISRHKGVREVAVIGVPDEKSGEAVKAFVVKADPSLTEASVQAHCRESLAAYKIPRSVEFRDDLPKSPIGKILRKDLRTPVAPQMPSAG